jgi:hypothetical protein
MSVKKVFSIPKGIYTIFILVIPEMKFNKNIRVVFFIIANLLCLNCHSNRNKANFPHLHKHTTANKSADDLNENFEIFFEKFRVDSVFQKSRIEFPLKYTISGDEGESDSTKFIIKNQLKFIKLFTPNKDKGIVKKTQLSPKKVQIQFQIEDTGFEKEFIFDRKDNNWYLVLVIDNSD